MSPLSMRANFRVPAPGLLQRAHQCVVGLRVAEEGDEVGVGGELEVLVPEVGEHAVPLMPPVPAAAADDARDAIFGQWASDTSILEVSEGDMLEALTVGHRAIKDLVGFQNELLAISQRPLALASGLCGTSCGHSDLLREHRRLGRAAHRFYFGCADPAAS